MPEPSKTLVIRALGVPDVRIGDAVAPPELTWRKHLGLIVYLARSPGGARHRDHLVALLWPDKDESKARHSLNEACRAVRRALGDDALTTAGDRVCLALDRIDADWVALERALEQGATRQALELWRGEFLEGFVIADASPFEDWLAVERSTWRRRLRDTLTAFAEAGAARGQHREARAIADAILRHDPLAERALRLAMLADALAGAAPEALGRFDTYARRLADEVGGSPAADLLQLAERVRAGHRQAEAGAPPAAALAPLVGREAAIAALQELCVGARGTTVGIVAGAAGVGRSRVLREVAERARLEGSIVVSVTCVPADADASGAVAAALLRHGLAHTPGFGATPPEALGHLARLEPAVSRLYPGVAPAPATSVLELGRALGEAAAAVAGERPLVLMLDDAQLADDATLAALPVMLRSTVDAPLLLLLGLRTSRSRCAGA